MEISHEHRKLVPHASEAHLHTAMQSTLPSEQPGWDRTHSPRPLQSLPSEPPMRPGHGISRGAWKDDADGSGERDVELELAGTTPPSVVAAAVGEGDADREADATGSVQRGPSMPVLWQSHTGPSGATTQVPEPHSMDSQPVTCRIMAAKAMVLSWSSTVMALGPEAPRAEDMAARAPSST